MYLHDSYKLICCCRSDVPRYYVYSKGRIVNDTFDLLGYAWDDMVAFYTGCSFSWECALLEAGLELRNVTEKKLVSLYQSNAQTHSVGLFSGAVTVTMRPFLEDTLERVVEITAQFSDAHGAPIHIGDPSRIGIRLDRLQKGDRVEVKDGEVPVFWACGFTNVAALANASQSLQTFGLVILPSPSLPLIPYTGKYLQNFMNRMGYLGNKIFTKSTYVMCMRASHIFCKFNFSRVIEN